jgi:hypothetical protein
MFDCFERIRTMNKEKARAIAAEHLSEGRQTPEGVTPVIIDAETQEREFGWVFFYDSKEYVETGDFIHAIPGNAPVVVLRDGAIRTTGTARPLSEYLNEIETRERRR